MEQTANSRQPEKTHGEIAPLPAPPALTPIVQSVRLAPLPTSSPTKDSTPPTEIAKLSQPLRAAPTAIAPLPPAAKEGTPATAEVKSLPEASPSPAVPPPAAEREAPSVSPVPSPIPPRHAEVRPVLPAIAPLPSPAPVSAPAPRADTPPSRPLPLPAAAPVFPPAAVHSHTELHATTEAAFDTARLEHLLGRILQALKPTTEREPIPSYRPPTQYLRKR